MRESGADAFIVDPMSGNDIVFNFEAEEDAQGLSITSP